MDYHRGLLEPWKANLMLSIEYFLFVVIFLRALKEKPAVSLTVWGEILIHVIPAEL